MANPNKPRSHKKTQAPLILRSLRFLVVFCCFFLRRDVALWANLLPDHHYCWNNPGFRCTASYFSDTILNGLSQQCENKFFFSVLPSLTHIVSSTSYKSQQSLPPPGGGSIPARCIRGEPTPFAKSRLGEKYFPPTTFSPLPGAGHPSFLRISNRS